MKLGFYIAPEWLMVCLALSLLSRKVWLVLMIAAVLLCVKQAQAKEAAK